jgi:hypothetical protein
LERIAGRAGVVLQPSGSAPPSGCLPREALPFGPVTLSGVRFVPPAEPRFLAGPHSYAHLPAASLTDGRGHAADGHDDGGSSSSGSGAAAVARCALSAAEVSAREHAAGVTRAQLVAIGESGGVELAPRGFPLQYCWRTEPDLGLLFRGKIE